MTISWWVEAMVLGEECLPLAPLEGRRARAEWMCPCREKRLSTLSSFFRKSWTSSPQPCTWLSVCSCGEKSKHICIVFLNINRRIMSLHIKEELPSLLFISLHPRPRLRIVHINKGHLRPTIGAQYTTIQGVISAMHQGCSTKTAGEIQ